MASLFNLLLLFAPGVLGYCTKTVYEMPNIPRGPTSLVHTRTHTIVHEIDCGECNGLVVSELSGSTTEVVYNATRTARIPAFKSAYKCKDGFLGFGLPYPTVILETLASNAGAQATTLDAQNAHSESPTTTLKVGSLPLATLLDAMEELEDPDLSERRAELAELDARDMYLDDPLDVYELELEEKITSALQEHPKEIEELSEDPEPLEMTKTANPADIDARDLSDPVDEHSDIVFPPTETTLETIISTRIRSRPTIDPQLEKRDESIDEESVKIDEGKLHMPLINESPSSELLTTHTSTFSTATRKSSSTSVTRFPYEVLQPLTFPVSTEEERRAVAHAVAEATPTVTKYTITPIGVRSPECTKETALSNQAPTGATMTTYQYTFTTTGVIDCGTCAMVYSTEAEESHPHIFYKATASRPYSVATELACFPTQHN